ncbi:uncharacterized mitochondrial protein AtMg00860-like [Hevea brasiliensis]|uniref:uncharacterized mitochondrial protein AtMg00860-like n=1 Tax=Hevea brasiliensis TaxID=3981 RepID=UPI0025F5B887|nr:uncharacterized mitochondrial protein AtMg00860-like [Hevea brasiliensis]
MDEKRSKSLCLWCDEKFTPNHKCEKKQSYVMHLNTEEEEDDGNVEEMENSNEVLDVQLSLNAMWGIHGSQTMKLKDILIYSRNEQEHLSHLRMVLEVMKDHQLLAKCNKCAFGCRSIEYLGHVISFEGVHTDEGKIEAVKNWPQLKKVKQLRSFLALTAYFRRFIRNYGGIARPLTDMLKAHSFTWSDESVQAFQVLKQMMLQAPVLALLNFSKGFVVEKDASSVRLSELV